MNHEAPPWPNDFAATDHGDHWVLRCRICGALWRMKKGSATLLPLALLNHAYSHKEVDDDDK